MRPLRIRPILSSMRNLFLAVLLPLLALPWRSLSADPTMNLEQSVCGFKEPIIFWLWSNQAGRPDEHRLRGLPNAEDIAFTSRDGRLLRGYRLRAAGQSTADAPSGARGYLLVIQGNAMLADQILGEFQAFARAGYDVYVYDYRGYGRSQGKRRLKAMVDDYQGIIEQLNDRSYPNRLVYAMSFGGIVLLDAWRDGFDLDRVVVDSSPSRLSDYGCPASYDPLEHLPADCSRFLFIAGMQDRVVTPAMSRDLLAGAERCGARIMREPDFAHPFMDHRYAVHRQRFSAIEQFLLQD